MKIEAVWVIPLGLYLLSAIVTALFKPRTPEEYAALPPRLAAFLKTYAALGIDLPKLIEGIGQIVTKRDSLRPPKE